MCLLGKFNILYLNFTDEKLIVKYFSAAYLIKRQVYGHHEIYESLTDYEKIALEKLEIKLSTNWDSIKETAVRDMNEMNAWSIEEIIVLFSEQRAFWDVHRPLVITFFSFNKHM